MTRSGLGQLDLGLLVEDLAQAAEEQLLELVQVTLREGAVGDEFGELALDDALHSPLLAIELLRACGS